MSDTIEIKNATGLEATLQQLIALKASDIFVTACERISIRQHGEVIHTNRLAPDEAVLVEFLNAHGNVRIEKSVSDPVLYPSGAIDGAIEVNGRRFRYNFYRALSAARIRQTVKLSLRLLHERVPAPEEIDLPPHLVTLINGAEGTPPLKQGLVLVCGKTGQGKSTTLASLLQHRTNKLREHLITLEQPIEYILKDGPSIVTQREVGLSVDSFASGLRSILRQNPDTILVGEIRDAETAEIALRAAESGHIVFGTLHTSNAAQSIERFVNLFPVDQQPGVWNILSTTLKVLICQILVKAREEGRLAVREILVANDSVCSYIRAKDLNGVRRAIESGYKDHGMVNWARAADQLCRNGRINDQTRKDIAALGE